MKLLKITFLECRKLNKKHYNVVLGAFSHAFLDYLIRVPKTE